MIDDYSLLLTVYLAETATHLHSMQDVKTQCARLEQELRKSKRREEKLTALQYRLKEDVRLMGADTRSALAAVFQHNMMHDTHCSMSCLGASSNICAWPAFAPCSLPTLMLRHQYLACLALWA